MNKTLTYTESIERLEADLELSLKNGGSTLAGRMDIANLKSLVKILHKVEALCKLEPSGSVFYLEDGKGTVERQILKIIYGGGN